MIFLYAHPGTTQEAIFSAVTGKATIKKTVFRDIVKSGLLIEAGAGTKGDPFKYTVREIPVEGGNASGISTTAIVDTIVQ